MPEDIVFTQQQHIGVITLQREEALNALTLAMIVALQQQLQSWQNDESVHAVVILASSSSKAFCAGGDVRWLYEKGVGDHHAQMQFFWHEYRLNHFIHHFSKPYIALMDGVTMGGGVGISLHGSHPVATENFIFAMPETGIGFFPDIGASYLLSRCPGSLGTYLGLTGNRLNADEAKAAGFVKQHIPSDKLQQTLERLIEMDLSSEAHKIEDECLQTFAVPTPSLTMATLQAHVDRCFNQVDVESIITALEKGDEDWHHTTLKILLRKAPLSLKVTLLQIQKAKSMDMASCVKMDYCLVGHFMRDPDFYEGVRALLIDKDKSPHWQPNALSGVTNAKIADYFECGQPALPLEL